MRRLIFSNEKGAGMLLAGVAMAALGGAAFMMGDMFLNSEEVIKKDGKIVSYQLLVDTVRKNLYAGSNCTQTLATDSAFRASQTRSLIKTTVGGFTKGPMDAVNVLGAMDYVDEVAAKLPPFQRGVELMGLPLKLDDSPMTLEKNWKSKSGTSIKSMRLIMEGVAQLPSPYSGPRIVRYPLEPSNPFSATENLMAGNMYLVIEPDHKGINVWAPENRKYWIKLYTYVNPTSGEIHSCYDPTSEAIFCTETMKGVYINEPDIAANKRCRPDMGCFTYQSGIIPAGTQCPDSDYEEVQIASGYKTCTWCPSSPYNVATLLHSIDADDFSNLIGDVDWPDCNAANPYEGQSQEEAWNNYNEYYYLKDYLTPEQTAEFSACLAYAPPCYDPPDTCTNECTGDNSACGTTVASTDTGTTTTGTTTTTTTGTTTTTTTTRRTIGDETVDRCGETTFGTCFIAGTNITMADGNLKSIEDVLLGERVVDGSYKTQKVEHLFKKHYKGLIYGINGGKHFFTPNHPFMTVDGWKSLDPAGSMKEIPDIQVTMLKVGDILVTKNGFEPIYSLDGKEFDDYVYNFTISGSHEYFADDYLVHNKPPQRDTIGRDDFDCR